MEQVAAGEVIELLNEMRIAYDVFDFYKLGVPQHRKRIIAGSPHLIAKLRRVSDTQVKRSVHSHILKPRGTHVRGGRTSKRNNRKHRVAKILPGGKTKLVYPRAEWSDFLKPIDGPAPTVIGRHALTWITRDGLGLNRSVLRAKEMAALQTFPSMYRWPPNKEKACIQIGNSVPPRVAELLMRGEQHVKPPTSPSLRRAPGPLIRRP